MRKAFLLMAYLLATPSRADIYLTNRTFPACAIQCMRELDSIQPDTSANITCICTDETLKQNVEECVRVKCTIKDSLSSSLGHRHMSQSSNITKVVLITSVVGISLALTAFVLRLLARMTIGQFGLDDLTLTAAMGFAIPLSTMAVVLANRGLGKDIWSLPFEDITYILYIYYFDELLYLGSLTMIRLSILCLYLRIFPQRWFKLSIYAMMATNTIYGAAFVLLSIFQCKPVQAAWTRWDGTVSANCVNVNALAWTSAAVNIVLDVITVILPLPALTRLAMSQKRKTHMFGIFSLGVFVIIVSILRLTSLVKFANTQNATWDYVPVGYWSTIEVHVSIICACIPTLPVLFRGKSPPTIPEHSPAGGESTRSVRQPKNRDSDVLPLLKIASVNEPSMVP